MRDKDLNLALAAILIAGGGAFASTKMVTLVDVYVRAQAYSGDGFVCKKTIVQCINEGTLLCLVTVSKTTTSAETVAGRDSNCVLVSGESDVPQVASWAPGVLTPFEVE